MGITGAPIPVEVTPEINELGRYAVEGQNKKQNTSLEFKKVLSALKQLVDGFNYYLTVEAAYEGKSNLYEATVYTDWNNNFKEVTKFNIVKGVPGGINPIDVTPTVTDLGSWAVQEQNAKAYTPLKFNKVWSAKEQIVEASKYYYLTLEAAQGEKNNVYEAKVFVSPKYGKDVEEFKFVCPAA